MQGMTVAVVVSECARDLPPGASMSCIPHSDMLVHTVQRLISHHAPHCRRGAEVQKKYGGASGAAQTCSTGQGRETAGQGRAGQGQDRAGRGRAGAGQGRARQDRAGRNSLVHLKLFDMSG